MLVLVMVLFPVAARVATGVASVVVARVAAGVVASAGLSTVSMRAVAVHVVVERVASTGMRLRTAARLHIPVGLTPAVMMIAVVTVARGGRVEVAALVSTVVVLVVAATVTVVYTGLAYEELVAVLVAVVHHEAEVAVIPYQWAVEVRGVLVLLVLVSCEYIAQVGITASPVGATHPTLVVNTEQIVEVDFIHCLILCATQSQLMGHLVA